jgi:hypothetical protein
MNQIQVDAALGGLADAIGRELESSGLEDASGARRAVMTRMQSFDFAAAARLMGCSENEAVAMYLTHLP